MIRDAAFTEEMHRRAKKPYRNAYLESAKAAIAKAEGPANA